VFINLAGEFACFSQFVSNQPQAVEQYRIETSDRHTDDGMKILFASKQARARSADNQINL
jgi:hypothetical protein